MAWIPIGFLLVAAGWLTHRVLRDRRSVREAQGWKRTTGQVIGWRPPARDPRGELHVVYEYRVDGATFRNDLICAGLEQRRGSRARQRAGSTWSTAGSSWPTTRAIRGGPVSRSPAIPIFGVPPS